VPPSCRPAQPRRLTALPRANSFELPQPFTLANLEGLGNADADVAAPYRGSSLASAFERRIDASLTWAFVAWLRSVTRLPIYVKARARDRLHHALPCTHAPAASARKRKQQGRRSRRWRCPGHRDAGRPPQCRSVTACGVLRAHGTAVRGFTGRARAAAGRARARGRRAGGKCRRGRPGCQQPRRAPGAARWALWV